MKKVMLIVICPIMVVIAGCKVYLDGPEGPSSPGRYARIHVRHFHPTAIQYDVVTTIHFEIEWEINSTLIESVDIDVIFPETDSCRWKDPIIVDTIREPNGQTEFTTDVLFSSPDGDFGCQPYAIFRIYQYDQRYQRAQQRVYFDVIPKPPSDTVTR